MKIFIGGIATETNTFAPLPTGWRSFEETPIFHGDATRHEPRHTSAPLFEWRRLAEAEGHTVAEGLAAAAQPAGRTLRGVYEALRDELLENLRAAMPVDVVLLAMHGAMAAEGYDDCEGDILARVREIVGPKAAIGAELDLHCHTTKAMLDNATAIIAFKEYPHVDAVPRAAELYRICVDAAAGKVKPVTGVFDCRMVSMWRTTVEPMKSFVKKMQSFEGKDGILSVSFGHGFPWGDVADVGAKFWVIADGDKAKAERLAETLGREIFEMREATKGEMLSVDEALDRALAAPRGPVVIADVADNAGGGAPSDSTFILKRLLERGVGDVASGCYWDPVAVQICREAGIGASFDLRIGGKCGPTSGDPVDLKVTVRNIVEAHSQTSMGGPKAALGPSVWVEAEGIDLVLASVRSQTFNPDAFTGLGIELAKKRIVVVKSSQHFYAGFSPIASTVLYAATPGAIAPDFAAIPFTKRDGNYWPRVANPFA